MVTQLYTMIPALLLTFWNTGWLEFPFFGFFFSISWWPTLHVHKFKDQQLECHKFMPSTYYAVHCLLRTRSSGGCSAVAQHATIFSMLRHSAGWQRRVAARWTPKKIPWQACYSSGILYTWYKAVQDGMYWYKPVRTLLDTRPYEKPQNGTYQYVPT